MVQPHEAPGGDELARMGAVDADPRAHRPTVADEAQILAGQYGPADQDGFFTGEPNAAEPG